MNLLYCGKRFSFFGFFFIEERSEVYHKQKEISNPHRQIFNKCIFAYKYKQTEHKQKYSNKNDSCNYVLLILLSALVKQEDYNSESCEKCENKSCCPVAYASGSHNNFSTCRGQIDSKINCRTAEGSDNYTELAAVVVLAVHLKRFGKNGK